MTEIGIPRPNEALQAIAAATCVFEGAADSLLPRFVAAQPPAAMPELCCSAR